MKQDTLKELVISKDKFDPRYVEEIVHTQYGDRKDKKVLLGSTNNTYVCRGKAISKLCSYLGLKRRQFNKIVKDSGVTEATNTLTQKWKAEGLDNYKLLLHQDTVLRITSIEYIGVPHSVVQSEIETRLKAEGITFEKVIKHNGSIGFYQLKNQRSVVEGIVPTIHYYNKNSGDKSIRFNCGGMVLLCSNGMMSDSGGIKIRLIHRMDLKDLRKKINDIIGSLLEKVEQIPVEFERLKKLKLSKEDALKKVEELKIPKYLQQAVRRHVEENFDGSYWSLFMASTYVGTHLEQVPKGKKKIMKDVSEDHSVQMQNISLLAPLIQVK